MRSYYAAVNRHNPTCILYLIDQSASMGGPGVGPSQGNDIAKSQAVADAVNRAIYWLALKSVKGNQTLDYFDVGVVGYSVEAHSLLGGELCGRDLVSSSQLAEYPLRVERSSISLSGGGTPDRCEERYPVWIEPNYKSAANQCAGLCRCHEILEEWTSQHPRSFPPLVFHFTEGEPQDGNPLEYAEALKSLSTEDGNTLLFNCYLASASQQKTLYPMDRSALPDRLAELYFDMASVVPEPFACEARERGTHVRSGARGLIYGAEIQDLTHFVGLVDGLTIGTRTFVG